MTACQASELARPPLVEPVPRHALAAFLARLLRRWSGWRQAARRERLLSREAVQVELLVALHSRRDPAPHTPDALRDAYRLFNAGDPFRFL